MKINRSRILIIMGVIMLTTSVVLEGNIIYNDYKSRNNAKKIESKLEKQITDGSDNNNDGIVIDNKKYCGILEIPKIKVLLPVASDYSYEQMSSSLCRYMGSIAEKNMIICGHNNNSFLGKLSDIFEGDSIFFINCDGKKYEFIVNEVEVIGGYDTKKLIDGGTDWDVSVFTCDYSGYSRYVVRCKFK